MSPLPWAAILTHGPTIVASARRLLETVGTNQPHEKNQTMEARLDQLERASLDTARLLQELAERIEAVSAAQARAARRERIVIAISILAAVLAIASIALAW